MPPSAPLTREDLEHSGDVEPAALGEREELAEEQEQGQDAEDDGEDHHGLDRLQPFWGQTDRQTGTSVWAPRSPCCAHGLGTSPGPPPQPGSHGVWEQLGTHPGLPQLLRSPAWAWCSRDLGCPADAACPEQLLELNGSQGWALPREHQQSRDINPDLQNPDRASRSSVPGPVFAVPQTPKPCAASPGTPRWPSSEGKQTHRERKHPLPLRSWTFRKSLPQLPNAAASQSRPVKPAPA